MNQSGYVQTGVGEATGRAFVCPTCRKPLPCPDTGQIILLCSYCRTETVLSPPLKSSEITSISEEPASDRKEKFAMGEQRDWGSTGQLSEKGLIEDDFEISLEPESERLVPAPSLAQWHTSPDLPHHSSVERDRRPVTSAYSDSSNELANRSDQAKNSYNQSAGLYPRERHYPTLEAMQRLYKLFGYLAVFIVFPYLGSRFLYLLATTKQDHIQVFAEFSEFAVPLLFGCLALTASLFAAAEGIRLAMDIQENTLRIANSAGRRKVGSENSSIPTADAGKVQ